MAMNFCLTRFRGSGFKAWQEVMSLVGSGLGYEEVMWGCRDTFQGDLLCNPHKYSNNQSLHSPRVFQRPAGGPDSENSLMRLVHTQGMIPQWLPKGVWQSSKVASLSRAEIKA